MSKYTFGLIIPLYGKTIDQVGETLIKNIEVARENKTQVVIVYKNNPENIDFNYDSIAEYQEKFENLIVIEAPFNLLRTKKTILGLEHIESKYVQIMDPHHEIEPLVFKKFIKFLSKTDENYIYNTYFKNDLDFGKIEKFEWGKGLFSFGAGSSTYKTKMVKKLVTRINFDIIYLDDWTFSNLLINEQIESSGDFNPAFIDLPWYIRNQGTGISTTSKVTDINISGDVWISILNIYDAFNKLDKISENILTAHKAVETIEKFYFIERGGSKEDLEKLETRSTFLKKKKMITG